MNPTDNESLVFVDRRGGEWDVSLSMLAARRIDDSDFSVLRKEPFSFLRPTKELFGEILTDAPLLFAIIWAVVSPQAKSVMGIDAASEPDKAEAEFLDRLDGRVMEAAREAFWRSLTDFFRDHKIALETLYRQTTNVRGMIGKELERMEPEVQVLIGEEIRERVKALKEEIRHTIQDGKPGGKSPESLESSDTGMKTGIH